MKIGKPSVLLESLVKIEPRYYKLFWLLLGLRVTVRYPCSGMTVLYTIVVVVVIIIIIIIIPSTPPTTTIIIYVSTRFIISHSHSPAFDSAALTASTTLSHCRNLAGVLKVSPSHSSVSSTRFLRENPNVNKLILGWN